MHATTISICKLDLKNRILEDHILDGYYLHVKEMIQQKDVQHKYEEYQLKDDGTLMHKNKVYVVN